MPACSWRHRKYENDKHRRLSEVVARYTAQKEVVPASELPTGLPPFDEQGYSRQLSGPTCACRSSRTAFLRDPFGLVKGG